MRQTHTHFSPVEDLLIQKDSYLVSNQQDFSATIARAVLVQLE